MIRCSCHGAHGCVPVAPSAIPIGSTSACSCAAALGQRGRDVGERLATSRLDLDLGGDQLADEVRLEHRALRRGLHVLEPVDEPERCRIEQRELLLDRDGEVGAGLEGLAGLGEELFVPDPLLVAHSRKAS